MRNIVQSFTLNTLVNASIWEVHVWRQSFAGKEKTGQKAQTDIYDWCKRGYTYSYQGEVLSCLIFEVYDENSQRGDTCSISTIVCVLHEDEMKMMQMLENYDRAQVLSSLESRRLTLDSHLFTTTNPASEASVCWHWLIAWKHLANCQMQTLLLTVSHRCLCEPQNSLQVHQDW